MARSTVTGPHSSIHLISLRCPSVPLPANGSHWEGEGCDSTKVQKPRIYALVSIDDDYEVMDVFEDLDDAKEVLIANHETLYSLAEDWTWRQGISDEIYPGKEFTFISYSECGFEGQFSTKDPPWFIAKLSS